MKVTVEIPDGLLCNPHSTSDRCPFLFVDDYKDVYCLCPNVISPQNPDGGSVFKAADCPSLKKENSDV